MLLVLLPLAQGLSGEEGQGLHEDSVDTWHVSPWQAPGWALRALRALRAGEAVRVLRSPPQRDRSRLASAPPLCAAAPPWLACR